MNLTVPSQLILSMFKAPRVLLPSQKPNLHDQSFTSDDIELISPLSTPTNRKKQYCQQDDVEESEFQFGRYRIILALICSLKICCFLIMWVCADKPYI